MSNKVGWYARRHAAFVRRLRDEDRERFAGGCELATGDALEAAAIGLVGRFVLVERSVYDGDLWLTGLGSPEDASDYRAHQEYPEDWTVEMLYDLATGRRFEPAATIEWQPA